MYGGFCKSSRFELKSFQKVLSKNYCPCHSISYIVLTVNALAVASFFLGGGGGRRRELKTLEGVQDLIINSDYICPFFFKLLILGGKWPHSAPLTPSLSVDQFFLLFFLRPSLYYQISRPIYYNIQQIRNTEFVNLP